VTCNRNVGLYETWNNIGSVCAGLQNVGFVCNVLQICGSVCDVLQQVGSYVTC